MKKLFSLCLSVILLAGCFCSNAFAEEASYPPVHHVYTTTEDFSSDEWSVIQRGAYLGSGTSTIARADKTHIHISGATTATQTCDKVVLTLHVERSKSYATGYSTYKTYQYSEENVYQVAKGISDISVERGYYYRVFAVHSVTKGSTIETTDSVTNPLDYT